MSFFRSKVVTSGVRQLSEGKPTPFRASVRRPELTDEQVKKSMEHLHDDLKSRRERTTEAIINSTKSAEKYYSDWNNEWVILFHTLQINFWGVFFYPKNDVHISLLSGFLEVGNIV